MSEHEHENDESLDPEEMSSSSEEDMDEGVWEEGPGGKYQGKEFQAHVQGPTEEDVVDILKELQKVSNKMGMENQKLDSFNGDPDGGFEAIYSAHNWNPFAKKVGSTEDLEKKYGEASSDSDTTPEWEDTFTKQRKSSSEEAQSRAQAEADRLASAQAQREEEAAWERIHAREAEEEMASRPNQPSGTPNFNTKAEEDVFKANRDAWYDILKRQWENKLGDDGKVHFTPLPDYMKKYIFQKATEAAAADSEGLSNSMKYSAEALKEGVPSRSVEWKQVWDPVSKSRKWQPVLKELTPAGQRLEAARVREELGRSDFVTGFQLPLAQRGVNLQAKQIGYQESLMPLQHGLNKAELETELAVQPMKTGLLKSDYETARMAQPLQRRLALGNLQSAIREQKKEEFEASKTGKLVGAAKTGLKTMMTGPGIGHAAAVMASALTRGRGTSTYTGDFYSGNSGAKMKALRTPMPTPRNTPAAQALMPDRGIPAAQALARTSNLAGAALVPGMNTPTPIITEENVSQGLVLPRMRFGMRRKRQPGLGPEVR